MTTMKELSAKQVAHEKECLVRYENIERRLTDGSKRFDRLENMLWGIYPMLIGLFALTKWIQ
jgi:hypothetical protein